MSNPLTYLIGSSWKYAERDRKYTVLFTVLFVLSGTLNLILVPWIWAKTFSIIQMEGITQGNINRLILLMCTSIPFTLCFWILHGPGRVIELCNAFKIRLNYRKFLMKGLLGMPLGWHAEHHSGDTIDKFEKGTGGLFDFSALTFEVIYGLIRLVGSLCMISYLFPVSGLMIFVMMIVTGYIVVTMDRKIITLNRKINSAENGVSESVYDSIGNISTVVTLRVERQVFDSLIKKAGDFYPDFKRSQILNETKWFLTSLSCAISIAVIMSIYLWQQLQGSKVVLIGNVFLLYRYLDQISSVFNQFTYMYGKIVQQRVKVSNAEELSQDFSEGSLSNHVLPSSWNRLNVSGLTFSYDNDIGGRTHLDSIDLRICRGERTAFVGGSGSGKSTMLKLMRDLHKPHKMRLDIDGILIEDGFAGIARGIALVPQEPEIFATTIRHNLTVGAEYAEADIDRAIEAACLREVINRLPKGIESSINEKGVNLSGGEKQRLALARGLLASRGKDIVLLDEPTSSLDAATERKVYRNIFQREMVGTTVVSAIHKLHLLPLFDRIVVFDEGKIVFNGTLTDAQAECPVFQRLWRKYKEESHEM